MKHVKYTKKITVEQLIPENVLLMKMRTMLDGIGGRFSRHPQINLCHLDCVLCVTPADADFVAQSLTVHVRICICESLNVQGYARRSKEAQFHTSK